jgi:hypothetical protein
VLLFNFIDNGRQDDRNIFIFPVARPRNPTNASDTKRGVTATREKKGERKILIVIQCISVVAFISRVRTGRGNRHRNYGTAEEVRSRDCSVAGK